MPESGEPGLEDIDISGLRDYLADTGIRFAILFGSYVRATADNDSDVDIALQSPDLSIVMPIVAGAGIRSFRH